MGKTLNKIGTAGAVAMAGVGAASIDMAVKFQSTMTTLVTQAGVSKGALKGLETGVLSLAGKVGFSPDSLGEALYHIESSFQSVGITGPKALSLLKTAAQGAAVGHADLVDVTNALDAVIASGIGGVKNYSQAMGVLNATVGSGDMKMQDLAEALGGGMLAVVKGYGITIKDVGSALAVFGDNNIRGAHAGTMLRMAVQALAVPAKAGAKELQNLGMTSDTLARDMRSGGLLKALDDLHARFVKNGVTAKEQGQVITTIFGKKAGAGIAVLMGQLDRLKSKYPDLTKAATGFGAAVATNNQTAAQKYKMLKAQLDATAITLGDKLLPAVTSVLNFTQRHLKGIEEFAVALGAIAVASKTVKMISVGFQVAKTANTWLAKLLAGGQASTVEVAAAGMQRAGDTMAGAAAGMQKAADTMVGADAGAGGRGGVAGAAGKAGKAASPLFPVGAGMALGAGLDYVGSRLTKHNPVSRVAGSYASGVAGMPSGAGQIVDTALSKLFGGSTVKGPLLKLSVDPSVYSNIAKLHSSLGGILGGSKVVLKGDITDLQKKLATARKTLDDPGLTKDRKAAVKGDISNLEAQIAKARAELKALNGTTAYTYVASLPGLPPGKSPPGGGHPLLASGGIAGAATGGIRDGLTMVGERGAELVRLSAGSRVYNHGQTQRMLAGGHGGPARVVLEVRAGSGTAVEMFITDLIRRYVQAVGGDVQVAFGRTA